MHQFQVIAAEEKIAAMETERFFAERFFAERSEAARAEDRSG